MDNDYVETMDSDDQKSLLLEEDIIMKRNLTLEGDLIHDDVQIKGGTLFFNNAKSIKTKSNVVTDDNPIFATVDYLQRKIIGTETSNPPKISIKENDEEINNISKKLETIQIDDLINFLSGNKLSDIFLQMDKRIYKIETEGYDTSSLNKSYAVSNNSNALEIESLKAELRSCKQTITNLEAQIESRLLALENPSKTLHATEIFASKIQF